MSALCENMAKFFFEAGMLSRFKRSGFDFLGTGNQNIASHVFRTAVIGYFMASGDCEADPAKTALLCLFHDLPETRTGDINAYQKKYVEKDEKRAASDMFRNLPDSDKCVSFLEEFNSGTSKEAVIARDADVLELIFTLKEELDNGNEQASLWMRGAVSRLKTEKAVKLAEKAMSMKSYDWWHEK